MRADNRIGDDGAASLAPSLERMAQLTSLSLSGTLRASAASCAVSGCLRAGNALMVLRVVGWGGCARGCSGWAEFARGEPRGGGACRNLDRSSWGSVACTESLTDDAADGAGPQRYAACIGGSCAVSGCLRSPAMHGRCCVLRAGADARGAVAGGRGLRGASRGAAVRAVCQIDAVAPSLGRMSQLTSLDLCGTLHASVAAAL